MALYRKYRPASFAEVVGQEHVTEPLSVALDSGQINHAYLFSGPRGCGKTSSARILARSLNCVQGPTATPCGVCDSCISLAPGGPGNLDVTELDAATHNGVDDMRELRDRAFYAPADSRYRVFIIDEAHMISKEGFNALLKIVEEPPEHLIFIFATTEPEKMLATIRSRTHNYPFRLLTPPAMRGLLERVVEGEGKQIEDAVYPLVVRAGGGSPRDSLSVMDQLLAGSGPEGVTYQRALALLGVTDAALIDKAVDALADQDQAALFGVVDDVIDAGYDPRRFATDLLDRFRDLLIVQAVPDAFERGLVDAPAGAQEVLIAEAQELGQATLTRCAALVNEGLAQMRGATSPRLLLEILCARMALPAAGMTVEALAQRVEALEQGKGAVGGAVVGGAAASSGSDAPAQGLSSGKRYERPSRRAAATAQPEPAPEQKSTPAPVQENAQPSQQESTPEPQKSEQPQAPAQPEPQEDPAIVEARRAREIMDRNRGAAAPKPAERPAEPAPSAKETSSRDVAAQWTKILEVAKDIDLSAWIAARDAKPAAEQPKDDELHITHHTGALASFVNKNQPVYSTAAERATGTGLTIVATVGGFTLGKAEAAPQAATQEESQNNYPDDLPPEPPETEPAPEPEPTPEPQHSPVPTEHRLDPSEIRSASSSALERARAMAEAHKTTAPKPEVAAPKPAEGKPVSGWKARAERLKNRSREAEANSFNGVPLPPEPPADPWDSGPADNVPPDPQQGTPPTDLVASQRKEEDEILDQIAQGPGELDHRKPLDIAGELVEKHLGGERLR